MSSKDMNMLDHVGELCDAGVTSFKIEGRIKSAYYASVVTNAYRIAVDSLCDFVTAGGSAMDYVPDPALQRELEAVSHREYCTGFYYDKPAQNAQLVTKPGYVRDKAYLAVASGSVLHNADGSVRTDADGNPYCGFTQRNKLRPGDRVELLHPGNTARAFTVTSLLDAEGNPLEATPHPMQAYYMPVPFDMSENDILRAGD